MVVFGERKLVYIFIKKMWWLQVQRMAAAVLKSVSLSDLICSNSRSAEAQLNFSNLYTSFRSDMSFINIIFDVKSLQN